MPHESVARTLAIQRQQLAAQESIFPVLLVAGPGSGKSATIEARFAHLISHGTAVQEIFAISFTNASTRDLKERIIATLSRRGITGTPPSVSTLHSLALRSLRMGNLIQSYPSDPQVLDDWEIRHIIDEEYIAINGGGLRRARDIRRLHEAVISTGTNNPPNYVAPSAPITTAEASAFDGFVRQRRQVYACVLPGEIVREAVTHATAGLLDPVTLLSIKHLIVDEFQDLNPIDLQFVHGLIANGATAFVCGDDDQSIYSFRYGSPKGMQDFPTIYGSCASHTLEDCFRCTPTVLDAAQTLIAAYSMPQRLPKVHRSLYVGSNPMVPGVVERWKFNGGGAEAKAVASSCATLINGGLSPDEIMILLNNQSIQTPRLYEALDAEGIPYQPARDQSVLDTDEGRLCLSALRVISDPQDYVAQRVLFGLQPGVASPTCADVTDRALAASISAQQGGTQVSTMWSAVQAGLPPDMTLRELRDYLWSDNDEEQSRMIASVFRRLNQTQPAETTIALRVRVMSIHGAKGLSAGVVFIPGLEEQLLPGRHAGMTGGGVYEAARLLYVAITRAKAACIISYSTRRGVQGKTAYHSPSLFTAHLAGPFSRRTKGLSGKEVTDILSSWNLL